MKLSWIISVGFNRTDKLLITHSAIVKYWRKYGSTMGLCTNYLWTSRKPM